MKYILFFFLVSTAAIVMPNMVGQTKQSPAETAVDSTKLSLDSTKLSVDSMSWFEANLDLYIQEDYFTFDPSLYTKGLTKEAKAELSLACWLGSFTISDMVKAKNYLKVDFSSEEVKKVMYITKTFFVLTSYTTSGSGMDYGSSLLYDPNTNTLKELESIIVYNINNNTLECSREQITQDGFKIEYGHYDVPSKKFVVEFVE
jgi:hypothetical protein